MRIDKVEFAESFGQREDLKVISFYKKGTLLCRTCTGVSAGIAMAREHPHRMIFFLSPRGLEISCWDCNEVYLFDFCDMSLVDRQVVFTIFGTNPSDSDMKGDVIDDLTGNKHFSCTYNTFSIPKSTFDDPIEMLRDMSLHDCSSLMITPLSNANLISIGIKNHLTLGFICLNCDTEWFLTYDLDESTWKRNKLYKAVHLLNVFNASERKELGISLGFLEEGKSED